MAGEIDSAQPERRQKDLFESLISDPLILFQAVLDDPDAYEEGLSSLLIDVINRRKSTDSLKPSERELLNRAVVDFATHTRAPKKQPRGASNRIPTAVQAATAPSTPARVPELPSEPPTFWWTRAAAERSRTD